ncbi:hypothetical protein KIN20_011450 [Parelaphostrongylus tenuis]|uniref:Uncharacterized protein n=1 Tax=Parelaphostrongylus tenuis TaxID=148309 RepID=A0AAD5MVD2_PARTN|nr:hypothetical protein KIN20_011450 [Parelaphostrongylus tenuis]
MAKLLTDFFMIPLLTTVSTVLGCGVMPAGQASTRTFTVTGFTTLPLAMVYVAKPDARFTGIANNREGAAGFVSRLVMQTIFDVLENQGSSALLPDAVISAILNQLTVRISYEPLQCQTVLDGIMDNVVELKMDVKPNCIIVGNAVTGVCNVMNNGRMCTNRNVVEAIPSNHTRISGTLTTTNIIMANWSTRMWQDVVNRAIRMLASRPFGMHFFSANAVVA